MHRAELKEALHERRSGSSGLGQAWAATWRTASAATPTHEVVAFDFDEKAVKQAVKNGAVGAASLNELVKQLQPPRIVWIMVPAGEPTQSTVDRLAKLLDRDDTIVDGGNTQVDRRQAPRRGTQKERHPLRRRGHLRRRLGPRGRLLHDGRRARPRRSSGWPRSSTCSPRRPTSESLAAIGPRGWLHFGPPGAGHYVKMVHNGVEYGLMQAYAEGFDLFDKCEYELDNAQDRPPLGPGLGRALVAVRTGRPRVRSRRQRPARDRAATPRTPARGAGRSPTRPPTTCPRP